MSKVVVKIEAKRAYYNTWDFKTRAGYLPCFKSKYGLTNKVAGEEVSADLEDMEEF